MHAACGGRRECGAGIKARRQEWKEDILDNNRNQRGSSGNGGQPRQNLFIFLIAALITLLIVSFMMSGSSSTEKEITYNEFIGMIDKGQIASVTIGDDKIDIVQKTSGGTSTAGTQISYYTGRAEDITTITDRLLKADIPVKTQIQNNSGLLLTFLLEYILPLILFWVLLSFLFRRMSKSGGGIMGVGQSRAKEYVQKETGITFADVAGEDEAKESLQEVVDFLHNPEKYSKIGAKLPKGALLVGPPGTGKTLLARAVAGEAHVPFFSLTGSDFIELYVGVGASRVRDLFREAGRNAPCIIFIDEIDAIGRSRDSQYGGGNEEREQTLNQLLSEMDGFDPSKGIIVLGATNRPEILDKALLRPGRFDRRIIVERPDLKGRVAILKVHSRNVKMDETVDLDEIALATSGAVGSDLANMINEAAINAVKNHREYVNQKDLFEAVEQVLVGKEKKDRIMNAEERRIVSYHEVGHALIAAVQKNSEPVQKITIVPRTMGALGYVMQVPEEEKYLNSKAELHDMIVGLLGGRAAEELKFSTVTTGASNDIEKATDIARKMITMYGMSEKFGLMGLATVESQYLSGRAQYNCADVTIAAVDEEVRKYLEKCYQEAKDLLSQHQEAMDKLAEYLIQRETITGKEFMKIYHAVEGMPDTPAAEDAPAGKTPWEELRAEMHAAAPQNRADAPGGQQDSASQKDEAAPQQAVNTDRADAPDGRQDSAPQEDDAVSQASAGADTTPVRSSETGAAAGDAAHEESGASAGTPAQPADHAAAQQTETDRTQQPRGRFSGANPDDLGKRP